MRQETRSLTPLIRVGLGDPSPSLEETFTFTFGYWIFVEYSTNSKVHWILDIEFSSGGGAWEKGRPLGRRGPARNLSPPPFKKKTAFIMAPSGTLKEIKRVLESGVMAPRGTCRFLSFT